MYPKQNHEFFSTERKVDKKLIEIQEVNYLLKSKENILCETSKIIQICNKFFKRSIVIIILQSNRAKK